MGHLRWWKAVFANGSRTGAQPEILCFINLVNTYEDFSHIFLCLHGGYIFENRHNFAVPIKYNNSTTTFFRYKNNKIFFFTIFTNSQFPFSFYSLECVTKIKQIQ